MLNFFINAASGARVASESVAILKALTEIELCCAMRRTHMA